MKEPKIISLYEKGFSMQKIASKMKENNHTIGTNRNVVWKILKKNNIKTREFGTYKRTKEHRDLTRKTLAKTMKTLSATKFIEHQSKAGKKRGEQLKLDIEHQKKAGKLGGARTIELHPEQSITVWSKKNPELSSKISSITAKSTHKKYPKLWSKTAIKTHKKYPGLASRMGKSTYKKHPEQSRLTAIKTHKKYPSLASRMGCKSAEVQSSKGFVSKPQKIMRELLPNDFIMDKVFCGGVPDFRNKERKIIIEVDGVYWHSKDSAKKKDKKQTKTWIKKGYKVFRITDLEVLKYFKLLFKI